MAPIDYKTALHQKLGSLAAADRMIAAVSDHGVMENLTYNYATMRFGDTSAAHAVIKNIPSLVLAQDMIERVYKAATTDGLDIFDRKVLVSLAKEIGITDTCFDFDSPQIQSKIVSDELEANQIANGVPLFCFNNKMHLSGARGVAGFEKVLLEAAATDLPVTREMGEGKSCGIDDSHR